MPAVRRRVPGVLAGHCRDSRNSAVAGGDSIDVAFIGADAVAVEEQVVASRYRHWCAQHVECRVRDQRRLRIAFPVDDKKSVAIVQVAQENDPLAVRVPGGGKRRVDT